ncbi:MAG: HPr family phosphocarrier protein [Gammaproteobacteria bacterium]|nr:HPr family phosphocarrier protein [Gammaproteobacteria bacterium]
MQTETVEIINKLGLHARAAAKLVSTAGRFSSKVTLQQGSQQADAKSIMAVMMLAASKGATIEIRCEGADEQQALAALVELIGDYFGEEE